jgi:fibronectin type 3 domain-containing protein
MKTFRPLLLVRCVVFLVLLFLLQTGNASAADVNWGAATLITADSDVSTSGTLVYAYNWNSTDATLNGVTFTGTRSVSTVDTNLVLTPAPSFPLVCDLPAGYTSQSMSISQQYQNLLGGAAYSDYAGDYFTVQLNNLVVGHIYQVQIWSCDSYYDQASTTVSDPAGDSVTLKKNNNNGLGGAGQFTIGTFTADGPSLVLTLVGVGPFVPDKGAMLNALQVRDISGGTGITWGSPMNIADDTDVSTIGTLLYAYDAVAASGSLTLNGVTFSNVNDGLPTPGSSPDMTSDVTIYSAHGFGYAGCSQNFLTVCALSATYQLLQDSAFYPSGTVTVGITLYNLINGHTYLVQVWDATSGYQEVRDVTYTSAGGNSVTLHVNVGGQVGTLGQYAIGTFTAIGTSQTFSYAPTITTYAARMNMIQVRDTTGGDSPPPAPTDVSATAGNAQVSLSWTASSGATSYNVQRSTTSGGPYTTIASPTTTSYTDTGLNNGTTYYYVVSAMNNVGESANSSQASATPIFTVPPVPTGLAATAGNAQVSLSWTTSSGATSYNVKRATTSGGPYTTIASPTTTSYTDTGLNNGTIYYYVVSAVNAAGESANSSQASATPLAGGGVVIWSAAVNIGSNSGEMDVSTTGNLLYAYAWGNVNATVNGVAFTGTAATSGSIPSSNPDITLTTSWAYYHNNSGPTSGLTAAYRTMLAGDIDQYSYNAGPQVITLNKLTIGHTYLIQAWSSSASDGWNNTAKQLTVTNANGNTVTCYGFGNPANGLGQYTTGTFTANATTQTFAIIGVNYGYPRINSIQVRDTTGGGSPPPTPTGLSATAGNAQVSLSWTASSGATSYNVKRATVNGGPYTTVASPTTTSYTDTGLNNGTTYYYVVSAVNGSGDSANSSQVSATPTAGSPPPIPTGLTATAGNAQVALSWNASTGATSYNIKRSNTSGGPFTTIASPTTTSHTDTGLNNGTTYYYVVSAVNAAGESANSSQASATPLAGGGGVTWSAAVNIGSNSGETDVSTSGNLLYAYAWGNINATVNGVAFTGTAATSGNIPSSNPDITLTTTWVYYHNNSGPTSGLTAAYRTMLAGDIDQYSYNAGPQTITLNKLTVGHTYLIQAWISSASDGWNNSAQQLTVTNANGNTVTCYGFGNPVNSLGQYTTGTFTANATTQTFAIKGINYGYPRINAMQVRDTGGN